jgi:hypothetical protein
MTFRAIYIYQAIFDGANHRRSAGGMPALLRGQHARAGAGQGLKLVQLSAQPKPIWSHLPVSPSLTDWGKSCTQRIPQNVLTLSRKVDVCKPLVLGHEAQCPR